MVAFVTPVILITARAFATDVIWRQAIFCLLVRVSTQIKNNNYVRKSQRKLNVNEIENEIEIESNVVALFFVELSGHFSANACNRAARADSGYHTAHIWDFHMSQGGHRSIRSIDRPIQSIDSINSIIFRSFENFWKDRLRRDDRFRPKIVKIRAILAIFRPFENFCEFRFDRFDIPFDSIDIATEGHGGPPCRMMSSQSQGILEMTLSQSAIKACLCGCHHEGYYFLE